MFVLKVFSPDHSEKDGVSDVSAQWRDERESKLDSEDARSG